MQYKQTEPSDNQVESPAAVHRTPDKDDNVSKTAVGVSASKSVRRQSSAKSTPQISVVHSMTPHANETPDMTKDVVKKASVSSNKRILQSSEGMSSNNSRSLQSSESVSFNNTRSLRSSAAPTPQIAGRFDEAENGNDIG